jgi:uncharacterized protein YfaS (alpha-2-macroglobulin family)
MVLLQVPPPEVLSSEEPIMVHKSRLTAVALALLAALAFWATAADQPSYKDRLDALTKAYTDGNFKDAYDGLRKLALEPTADPRLVCNALDTAVKCLRRLARYDETDELRETVLKAHADNWRLLWTAAQSYCQDQQEVWRRPHQPDELEQHYGFIIAGKFYRGGHRGGGKQVWTFPRDRARALQLMHQALPLCAKDDDKPALADFHLHFAKLLVLGAGNHEPWRLQYLTNLKELPDFEEGYWYRGNTQAAPVDADGNPVFHHLPKSYDKADSDGQRWRWMLAQAIEFNPARRNEVETLFADFLYGQFEVQTMRHFGVQLPQDDPKAEKTGTFALHTLKDDATIARLANGVKRFAVPEELNWIKIYRTIAERGKSAQGEHARDTLAQLFEDRRQYVTAAQCWKTAIAEYGPGVNNSRQQRLEQIVGNWGRFEMGQVQPAGKPAVVDFRFRNGDKVSFEAHAIDVPRLLADVQKHLTGLKSYPDWQQINIQDLGYRLVERNETHYLTEKVAAWDTELKPRPNHVDDRITVKTPLQKAGAYLLKGQMAGGNLSRIIVWVSDTVILKKPLDGKVFYYVADAVTGQPIPNAKLDFFGWKVVQVAPFPKPEVRVDTTTFTDKTNDDGQLLVTAAQQPQDYQWLITARTDKGQGNRFAYLGFTGAWYGRIYDPEYNQTKVFALTDRPAYRPMHTVHFKMWVGQAKYDQPEKSEFAERNFNVQIHNPKGEKVYDQNLTTDAYGGLAGDFPLSKDVPLGMYNVHIQQPGIWGGVTFRVEEYKKPEFEVQIDSPKEPVRLGEKVEATIKANYYFGAPVSSAKVKYKVLRNSYSSRWYPLGKWDWMYGSGYWWFGQDYDWYPGFAAWGCRRPIPWWWGAHYEPPEVVMEGESPISADGTVRVVIDTTPAKELHPDQDHQYSITAEVTDESRRTIVGQGNVLVARKPFAVYSWVNQGHYRAGDDVRAYFQAHTLDKKPVVGKGALKLLKVSYDADNKPVEEVVEKWDVDTNVEGQATQQFKAAQPGQYRLAYALTDSKGHTIEGGYVFVVTGAGFDGSGFRFNDVELITDKREYAPGEKVQLLVNTNQQDGVVLLFVRPSGVYQEPKLLRLKGKSAQEAIEVAKKDMPNFFVEAVTVHGGKVHSEMREVIVPPEKRVFEVAVLPNEKEYRPGEEAKVQVKLTDLQGQPLVGSAVVTVYDKSVEYIAGWSVPEMKEFFWKWRRHHSPQTESSLGKWLPNLLKSHEMAMSNLGAFGDSVVEEMNRAWGAKGEGKQLQEQGANRGLRMMGGAGGPAAPGAAPMGGLADREGAVPENAKKPGDADRKRAAEPEGQAPQAPAPTAVRKNFADTAFWVAALETNKDGIAEVKFKMPENLTGWKVRAYAMGPGTRVGQGDADVVTKKNILVRLQAPRFFTQKDEVVLSANVHNFLKASKKVSVALELEGGTLEPMDQLQRDVAIDAGKEHRVDWRVKVTKDGEAVVRMKALTDEESDAMEMRFPCYVHGILKTDSYAGTIRPEQSRARATLTVPAERRVADSRLEVRYSPSLAGAMVDALPYLVEYPYGCTEQTLNRFLPTVITQRILLNMKLDLKAIKEKRANLNAQEIDDPKKRAEGWQRFERNPVFEEDTVKDMAEKGVAHLLAMQCSDGGWGWFSGWGEHSYPHTTAVVVHGLQIAKDNGVVIPGGVIERGIDWLKMYQAGEVQKIKNAPAKVIPYKEHADAIDALVYMVLADNNIANAEMRELLYRDRTELGVYAKAMFGLALVKQDPNGEQLKMVLKNIEQFVVEDEENESAYLKLPESGWWYWYGSENEANAYYLKLLAKTNVKDKKASRLVKYILNNRKNATYWKSTRDTAVCIEALADYLKASGEDRPDMTVEVWLDDKKQKEVHIDAGNFFSYDDRLVLSGAEVTGGKHTLELRKKGTGAVYFNAYLTNFTLEDFITKAGLEVKVNRKYYKLTRVDATTKVAGSRGQAADQKIEKYARTELASGAELKSGDLVEVELEIDSKNDYEYLLFEDAKAAGFEAVEVRSGYVHDGLGAYMEVRDEKVCFFTRTLARGKHSISYRLRAEIPGKFSALPTRAQAMYAPELRGNSDEIKLGITD